MKKDSHLVTILWRIYRLLLVFYPAGHRKEFGREMSLAFRDYCRRSVHKKGSWGLFQIGLIMVVDLLATAFVERVTEVKDMSTQSIGRLLGIIGSLGGIYAAIMGVVWLTDGSIGADALPFMPFYLIAIGIGCLGLFLKANDLSSNAKIGAAVAFSGMVVGALGLVFMYILTSNGDFGWSLWFFGANFLHPIGLIAFGLSLLGLSRFWNMLPTIVGSLFIIIIILVVILQAQQQLSEQLFGIAMLILGIGWILMGLMPSPARVEVRL